MSHSNHLSSRVALTSDNRSILRSEDNYDVPAAFRPERFLLDGKLDESVLDPDTVAFGFGRR